MAIERVITRFVMLKKNSEVDIDIPLDISANELIIALNNAYELGIDTSDVKKCYLKSENPIALLRGNRELKEFGLRNGTIIYYTD